HAKSLHQISRVVDQTKNINQGFTPLGKKVLHALLDDQRGKPIYIDIKHMSVESRKEYMRLLETDYASRDIPLIVSHGGVTGTTLSGARPIGEAKGTFNEGDINFFDEELVKIAESGGLFALQVDRRRLAGTPLLRQSRKRLRKCNHRQLSAQIVWNQIQHVAEVLNTAGLPAWDMVTIGSDFDGNINPLYGYRTAKDLPYLAEDMLPLAQAYLNKRSPYLMPENRQISPEEIVQKFAFQNAADFLKLHY
ncbi:MAG: membrane dipeptidase, partial [Bacteroidota bacterium]